MQPLSSTLEAVQVYRRGATVVRTATIEGVVPDEVELCDLPLSLLDPTARVRVLAVEPAGADVVAAGVRVGLWVQKKDASDKAPEQKELDDVDKRLRAVRDQLAAVNAEIELLQAVQVPDRPQGEDGKPPPPSPMAARLQLEQFVDGAVQKRIDERRALRDQLHNLDEERRRIQERIDKASSAAQVHLPELKKSAVVRLRKRGAPPTKVKLELSYVVPGARWSPAYQCKLARDGSRGEIQLRAFVAQRSGEDWNGVRLKLSTAAPLSFTELPELSSIRIGRAQPAAHKRGFRPPPSGWDALFRDFDRDAARARSLLPPPRPWQAPALSAPSDAPAPARPEAMTKREHTRRAPMAGAPPPPESLDEVDSLLGDDEYESARSAPPPPAPAAAPMAGAPPPPRRPAPDGRAEKASIARERSRAVDDAVQALLYPLLRLPGPEDGQRGRLVPVDVRQAYLESLQRFGRPVPFDVMSAVAQAEAEARSVEQVPLPDGAVDADDISSHFDFAYDADGLVDIAGDGGFHSVPLGDRASDARMRYIAVPREELAVYRVAQLLNPIPAPLLPGPAEVYVGGEYVLTTRLPTVPARGELKLGLGVEQAIKVARNTRFAERRSGEKVVAMSELVHDIDVDVVNHLERDIDIEVRERVPVPAPGAEVVVEELKVEPAWEPYDQEERGAPIDGGRRWEISVPRGGSKKLHATYVVKIYAQNEVVGGNRREA